MATAEKKKKKSSGSSGGKGKKGAKKLEGGSAKVAAGVTAVLLAAAAAYMGWFAPAHADGMSSDNFLTGKAIDFALLCGQSQLVVAGVAAGLAALAGFSRLAKVHAVVCLVVLAVAGASFWLLGAPVEAISESIGGLGDR